MKKIARLISLFAVALMIFGASHAHGQVNFGLKGGLNFATIAGDDVENVDMRTGFHVGPFLEISLVGLAAIETGAYFSQKGYSFDMTFMGTTFEAEAVATYIDIPAVIKFRPVPLIHFYAGPQASILLDNEFRIDDESESSTEGMRPLDFALVLGAGVNIPGGFRANIGYDIGLTTLDEDGDFKAYNRVLKLTVGYRF